MHRFPRAHRATAFLLTLAMLVVSPFVQAASTPGSCRITATINDMATGSGAKHYALVWVTKADNTFITTLWKQGPSSFSNSGWSGHCKTWNDQRAGSTALPAAPDGYTSATATSYAATNPSPPATGIASNAINITWNCRDATNTVVPDGDYKFWIEYAEDFGTHNSDTGGLTTNGLTWTKGPSAQTLNPTNRGTVGSPSGGSNFTNISIVWTPSTVAPTITSAAPAGGKQGTAYSHSMTATGSTPITYSLTSGALPTGLTITSAGVISGTPTTAGTFNGIITASNGTAPNATQSFSITIAQGIAFTSSPPPSTGIVSTAYNHTCTAIGTAPLTFTVSSGALPTGLSLSPAGVISGTPTTFGTFTGVITASNGLATAATQNFSITIAAATPGTATLTATLAPLGSGSNDHWWVAWLTKGDGTFVKTLKMVGASAEGSWDPHWNDHCPTWYTAHGSNTTLDGYTAATATTYAAPHNPISVTWNGRDASNNVMPNGSYKLWIQYAEDIEGSPGPVTTNGLSFTKAATSTTANPAAQGASFTNMSIVWSAQTPVIAVEQPAGTALSHGVSTVNFGSVVLGGTASSKIFTIRNTGTATLTDLAVTFTGSHSNDYAVTVNPASSVAAGATTTFTVAFTAAATGTRSATLQIASNDSTRNPFNVLLSGSGITALQDWATRAGLPPGQDGPSATPQNDGVTNLMKFACNLNPAAPDTRVLTVGGNQTAGLPGQTMVNGKLRLEFLRRKASTNPGITYTPQFGPAPGQWTDVTAPLPGTSIDATWERVVVDDPAPSQTKRFARLQVVQSP